MVQVVYNICIGLVAASVIGIAAGMVLTLLGLIKKGTDRSRTRIGSYVLLGSILLATVVTTILLAIAPQINGG